MAPVRIVHGRPRDGADLRALWAALRSGASSGVAGLSTAGQWWGVVHDPSGPPPGGAFAACFDDVPTVLDFPDPQLLLAGSPAPGAGFVQIMRARVRDRAGWSAADAVAVPLFADARPDFLGTLRVWDGDLLTVVDSFRSEADARAGEARGASAAERAAYDAWFGHLTDVEWHDLTALW